MRFYSIIIPVYNRPEEIKELLESLTRQTFTNFEVLVIEDGSKNKCEDVVRLFKDRLNITYYYKDNTGQGLSRNYGYERANGDYFIAYDSDCLIPEHYLETVELRLNADYLDAYGGPDSAHESFTPVQKAISYSMTSLFTTGGIRGNKKSITIFHPRGFNMGISRFVWESTCGFIIPNMAEDIEFSIRMMKKGFKVGLIEDAHVYHKRRTDFKQFFKQSYSFGRNRINVSRFAPEELKMAHFFPTCFVLFSSLTTLLALLGIPFGLAGFFFLICYTMAILVDASIKNNSIYIGLLSIVAAYTQLWGYGIGFMKEGIGEILHPQKQIMQAMLKKRQAESK